MRLSAKSDPAGLLAIVSKMFRVVLCRFAVPFYLRLPTGFIPAWEPQTGKCVFVNFRHLGELTFSGQTTLAKEEEILDSHETPSVTLPPENRTQTCKLSDGKEIATLRVHAAPTFGFSELRSYSELAVFLTVEGSMPPLADVIERASAATNHLIDIYRAIGQDPFVRRLEFDLDVFMMAITVGDVPAELGAKTPEDVLRALDQVGFEDVPARYRYKQRVNTWEDLFPGPVLESPHLPHVLGLALSTYELPLHYDLILRAQSELKARNYYLAVLEAETAFEVFVARRIVQLAAASGSAEAVTVTRMGNPRDLGLLRRRLSELDRLVKAYRNDEFLPSAPPFVGSPEYAAWDRDLYRLRNEITHGGRRSVSFDEARTGIRAGKRAVRFVEDQIPKFSDLVQIYPDVDFLQNTAGRLRW